MEWTMTQAERWHQVLAFAYGKQVITGQQLAEILKMYRENQQQGELEL
jgi:hypothetical protein